MSYDILLNVAIILLCGLSFGRLGKLVKLPNVTGYLIAGLIIGPAILKILPVSVVNNFSVISEMALGFIAFSIGTEFKISYFKQVGVAPIIIAIMEAFGAVILVTTSMILLGFDVRLSILLGAIASATAPAQTIMVIQQYKAKGPVTSMLLSVVAIDDAVALICFGFAATAVKAMSNNAPISFLSVLAPVYEVLVSFLIGVVLGGAMALFLHWFHKSSNRISVIIAFVLLTLWTASAINASPLLACMALGVMMTNVRYDISDVIKVMNTFTPPIFMIFFVISGAGFDVGSLMSIGFIGTVYVVMRVVGKWFGAWLGGTIAKVDPNIRKYLGPTLMPQAGVAIGLILVAKTITPEFASQIQTAILGSTFIYSIIGPSVAKNALIKAGEIVIPDKKKV
ncbi:cation:proton antiporter [Oscillospiraceae bacterium LTW-04]|nr:cation:proton antiporter [Oscillospiraceae bacterium MB24-C1]